MQERWFAAQLELAEEVGLPLFLHCRDASDRFAALLAAHRRAAPGVAHCFTGVLGGEGGGAAPFILPGYPTPGPSPSSALAGTRAPV